MLDTALQEHEPSEYLAALRNFLSKTSQATKAQLNLLSAARGFIGEATFGHFGAIIDQQISANVGCASAYVLSLGRLGLVVAIASPEATRHQVVGLGFETETGQYATGIISEEGTPKVLPLEDPWQLEFL